MFGLLKHLVAALGRLILWNSSRCARTTIRTILRNMSEINLANVLELKRPLAVLDLETTGLSPERDRICQIAVTIHYPDKDPVPWVSLINPTCDIPSEVAAIHGITTEVVQDEPRFSEIGPRLYPHLEGADIMGYNVKFDIGFLAAEMKRAGVHWSWDGYIVDPLSQTCLLYTSPSPRDRQKSRMPSSA